MNKSAAYHFGQHQALQLFSVQSKVAALQLLKLAASNRGSEREEPEDIAVTAAKGLAGAAAPIAANTGAALALEAMPSYRKPDVDFSDATNFDKLKRQMGESGVALERDLYDGAAMGYDDAGKATAFLPKNTSEAIAGHEIGHAKNWRKVRDLLGQRGHDALWKARGMATNLGASTVMPAGFAAAVDPDASWAPGALQAGLYAPTLIDEGLASAHSLRNLVKEHGWSKGLRRGGALAPAFATYGAIGLTPAAITAGRKAWRRYNDNSDDTGGED